MVSQPQAAGQGSAVTPLRGASSAVSTARLLVALVMLLLLTVIALLLLISASAAAADPTPAPVGLLAGDSRSEGVGPGLVGSPLGVLVAVVALGVATAAITAILARLLQRR
jgi:hypothetical protein